MVIVDSLLKSPHERQYHGNIMTIFRFSILLVLSCVLYTFVFASDSKDSSGTATEAIDALPSLETSDEELILDNGGVKKKP
jgi:hypothetical protein